MSVYIGGILLENILFCTPYCIMEPNEEWVPINQVLTISGGELTPISTYMYVEGVPVATAVVDKVPPPSSTYDISGEVTPVGSTVYVSTVPEDEMITRDVMKRTIIASVVSDAETGAFFLPDLRADYGEVLVWTAIDSLTLYGALSTSMTSTAVGHTENLPIRTAQVLVENTTHEYENSNASFSVSGSVPEDVEEVYLAYTSATDEETLIARTEARTMAASNEYTLGPLEGGWGTYTVWCRSNLGEPTTLLSATISGLKELPPAQCLSGDTLILMGDNSWKRLQDVNEGDYVMSQHLAPVKVVKTARGAFQPKYTAYYFDDGTVIHEVYYHRFYNQEQGFWQLLENWELGEHALKHDGTYSTLVSKEVVEERTEMFGLWTEDHTYWANGLLSGETAANQSLLPTASAEKAVQMAATIKEKSVMDLFGWKGILP